MEKNVTAMKVTSVKMRYQIWILWSLLNLKILTSEILNIEDINSSSSDEEEVAEYKVKRISNSEWCECSAKAVVGRCSSK